ncbi:hypothetical protein PR048_003409 [Dryococelus australis]|uniref:DUF7869 domain-containing protein n=1 Tax=Dryococelus australis TaxID=614101 RepID=A0ABQ9IMZ6_9NEOP|nr:hypothetical protein PR048_003409 [Dryococelus australis]
MFITLFFDGQSRPESLTISKMHEMFLNTYHVNVPYKVYWSIFTQEFNIKFGFSRSGTCSICDTLAMKINNLNLLKRGKSLKQKIKVHLLNIEAFRKRKIFCRQALAGDGRKGSNEVTSMLLTDINNNNEPLDNCVLISDNCCGKNKNQTIEHCLFTLVHCFHVFKTVTYLFPVRGHSYLPNDQDFSLIDKKKQHIESVKLPEGWDSIIQESRKKQSPFSVVNIHYQDFVNMKAATDYYFLKSSKPPLKIVSTYVVHHRKTFMPECETHHGPWQTCIVLKKPMPAELDLPSLYATHPPIAPVKKKDLQQLMPFVNPKIGGSINI